MKKICVALLALLPLTALAYPIDVTKNTDGVKLDYTTYDTDRDLLRAVEAGAAGYLLKDTPRAQLVDAVRAAARGETVLAPAAAARLVRQLRVDHEALTARELDVLTEVARGTSNAAVAASLSIGEATVKSHLAHVYAKLGVEGRTAAVTRAMELGILPPPGP